ncbi:exodeoxyribonuclease V subunit alpha [Chitinolyticbacter meiyuanensis]|uniref:exodeoxyribonuclease V subunit alpha n=1 Tax=Chitinolyticbacter meiyuanensis TaxID=682798 RepID=UPI0011E5CF32|nr:exodeoxyribonuclease V subunit alpha [Chitinolyticbacter meiyuanensis]
MSRLADRLAATQAPLPDDFSPLAQAAHLTLLLDAWVARGWLRALDAALVSQCALLAPDATPPVLLAVALTSHQLGHGHACLDLAQALTSPDDTLSLPPDGEEDVPTLRPSQLLAALTLAQWQAALAASTLVDIRGDGNTPLILQAGRLYLRRYWQYEHDVAQALRQRLAANLLPPDGLAERLAALFPQREAGPDWQMLACALAARGAFTLITGGPGTGKTTTVVRLLALLQGAAVEAGAALRIRLAAPTGKAAARLSGSIAAQVSALEVMETVRAAIPTEVGTVHRLLGSRPDTRHFRHHAGNPLPLDVLIVDEASMIDLETMASLLAALPAHARLVLLGDKDQLASVEAGAVLGELCRDAERGHYDAATQAWLENLAGAPLAGLTPGDAVHWPLAQQTVMLRRSRRFDAGSGIGALANAVNSQSAAEARALLQSPPPDLAALTLRYGDVAPLIALATVGRGAAAGYRHYLSMLQSARPAGDDDADHQAWAQVVLQAFDAFRLLCAVRRGQWGVEALNRQIAEALCLAGLLPALDGWYEGRPVMVTRNDYGLGLMNGDIGITLAVPDGHGGRQLRVAFARNDGSGSVQLVLPSRLADIETVFAMTVHKSQGSEFAHTALVLPATASPIVTKELVYTGITRASRHFTLIEARAGVLEEAIARRVQRASGLLAQITSG